MMIMMIIKAPGGCGTVECYGIFDDVDEDVQNDDDDDDDHHDHDDDHHFTLDSSSS